VAAEHAAPLQLQKNSATGGFNMMCLFLQKKAIKWESCLHGFGACLEKEGGAGPNCA
jgi:hypothetical protein